ncbi:MAG TPA: DUF4424 domain-containing protein [Devosia sp.]|nr:DUF4424 domain-containing protein [Devosia sp.]
MRFALLAGLLLASAPAMANDTMAQLGTGGLVFVTNQDIEMVSENLSVSPEQVKVVYKFHNNSEQDQHILVAFPMPDIEGSGDFMVGIPTDDPENIFGFQTSFNGEPVDAQLHQYAFANNIDYSDELRAMGVPLAPFGEATLAALNGLSDADKATLYQQGLAIPMEYDAGEGPQVDVTPVWTLRSTYSWEAVFPAGQDADVVHSYKPSVGGTVMPTFMPSSTDDGYSAEQLAAYRTKYCVDDDLSRAIKKQGTTADGYTSYPFTESWISYVWSTGNNWSGPIGKFTLTVDKGDPANLVSFCGENVKKIGPTTFQMTANDWFAPYGRELEILLLVKNDSSQ